MLNKIQKLTICVLLLVGILSPEIILIITAFLYFANLVAYKKSIVNVKFLLFIFIVFLQVGLSYLCSDYYTGFKPIIQVLSLGLFIFFFVSIFDKCDLSYLIKYSIKIVTIAALLGYIQEISYLFNLKVIYTFGGLISTNESSLLGVSFLRLTSVYSEPSQYVIVACVPFACLTYNIFVNKKYNKISIFQFLIIFGSFLLTLSTNAYICLGLILIGVILKMRLSFKKIIFSAISIITLVILLTYSDSVTDRIDSLVSFFSGHYSNQLNLSSGTWYLNLKVSQDALKDSYFLGVGMGNYGNYYLQNYFKYDSILSTINYSSFNADDANSLFFRIQAEFGIFGYMYIIFIYYYIYKFGKKKNYSFISFSLFVLFTMRLIRYGNYLSDYWLLFMAMPLFNRMKGVKKYDYCTRRIRLRKSNA